MYTMGALFTSESNQMRRHEPELRAVCVYVQFPPVPVDPPPTGRGLADEGSSAA